MCLLISQTNNKPIERETLENADFSNPDGIGFAYADDGKIIIEKFREFEEFYTAYKKAVKTYGNVSDFILHFRFSTHGVNTGLFNVHPFSVNERLAFAHNGVLDVEDHKKKSDTRVFNETILRKLKPNFLNNTAVCQLLEGFIGSDKLVFLDSSGKSTILNESNGHWSEGVWYSNSSYKPYKSASYGWGKNYGYGCNAPTPTAHTKSKVSAITGACSWCRAYTGLNESIEDGKTKYLCDNCIQYDV